MLLAANPARFMDRESIQQHRWGHTHGCMLEFVRKCSSFGDSAQHDFGGVSTVSELMLRLRHGWRDHFQQSITINIFIPFHLSRDVDSRLVAIRASGRVVATRPFAGRRPSAQINHAIPTHPPACSFLRFPPFFGKTRKRSVVCLWHFHPNGWH